MFPSPPCRSASACPTPKLIALQISSSALSVLFELYKKCVVPACSVKREPCLCYLPEE